MIPSILPDILADSRSTRFNNSTSIQNFGALDSRHNANKPMTILALCRPIGNATNAGNAGDILTKMPSATNDGLRFFVFDNTGAPVFGLGLNSSGVVRAPLRQSAANKVVYGRWHWLAASFKGTVAASSISLYSALGNAPLTRNTTFTASTDGSGTLVSQSADPLVVGNRLGSDRTFNGDIALVVRWNVALSRDELELAKTLGPLSVRPESIIFAWHDRRDIGPLNEKPTTSTALVGGNPFPYMLRSRSRLLWTPSVSGGAVSKSVSDSGAASDALGAAVSLALSDSGVGADTSLALILIAIADALTGVDSIGAVSVSLAPTDAGTATDAIGITATLALSDAGSGADVVSVLTDIIKSVADIGAGADALGVSVALGLVDSGAGSDGAAVSVSLSLADAGSGVDSVSVITATLIAIADSLFGADAISSLTVSVPLSDSAAGADLLAISAAVSVLQAASGADVVVRTDVTGAVRIAKVVFTMAERSISFAMASRSISFTMQ